MKKKLHHRKDSQKAKKSSLKKEIARHVKEDVKDFKEEISRDKSLLKRLDDQPKHGKKHSEKQPKHHKDPKPKSKAGKQNKVKIVMEEFKAGKLHSGSKKGPIVTNPKQAIAIAISESKRSKKNKR